MPAAAAGDATAALVSQTVALPTAGLAAVQVSRIEDELLRHQLPLV